MEIQTIAPQIGFTLKSASELNSVSYTDGTGTLITGADMVGDYVLLAHSTYSDGNYLDADSTYIQTTGTGAFQHIASTSSNGKLIIYNAYDREDMAGEWYFHNATARFVIADSYSTPDVSVLSDQSNWSPLLGTRTHSDTWRGDANFVVAISSNSTADQNTADANYPRFVLSSDIATDTVLNAGGIEKFQERYNLGVLGDASDENYPSYIEILSNLETGGVTINLVEDVDGQMVSTNVQNENWVIKVRQSAVRWESGAPSTTDNNSYVSSIDIFQKYSEYTQNRNTLEFLSLGTAYEGSLSFTAPYRFSSEGLGVLAQNPLTDNAMMLLTQGAWYGFDSDDLTTDSNNNIIGDPIDALFKATNSPSLSDPTSDQIVFKNVTRSDFNTYTKITEYESIEMLGMSDSSHDGVYTQTSLTQFDKSGTDASVRYIDNRWVLTDSSGSIIQEISINNDITNAVSSITTEATEPTSDVDADGDGIPASSDPDDNNSDITGVDIDFDGIDDAVDTNPFDGTISGVDADNDGIDDAVDTDPSDPTTSGVDADGDEIDDAVDTDPSDPTISGVDADGDEIDDAVDTNPSDPTISGVDADGDGIDDAVDTNPSDPTTSGVDADGDGIDDAVTATNILGKIGQKVGVELKELKSSVSGDILTTDNNLNARIDDVVSIFSEQIGNINLNEITGGLNVTQADGAGVHPIGLGISTDGNVSIGGTLKLSQKLTALGEVSAQRATIGTSATIGTTLSVTGHSDLASVSLGGHLDAQSATFLGKLKAEELEISGTTKIINTTTVEVSDNILEINKSSDSSTTGTISGIEVNRGDTQDKAKFLWDNAGDQQLFKFMLGDNMADLSAQKLSVPNGSGIVINNVALGDYADFWNALSTAKQ